jgi:signal transduction histidine kinase/ActR/RegA family two-component response regulator
MLEPKHTKPAEDPEAPAPDALAPSQSPAASPPDEIIWRAQVLNGLLWATAALALLTTPYVVRESRVLEGWLGRSTIMVCYVTLFLALLWRSAPFGARLLGLLLFLYAFGTGGLLRVGYQVGPGVFLVFVVVISGLLLGRAALVAALTLCIATILGAGWFTIRTEAALVELSLFDVLAVRNWVRAAFTFALAAGGLAVAVTFVVERSTQLLQARTEALERMRTERETRKRAEAARDAAQSQISQMQRIEAVGQLAGGIAHDFNNALMVILGWADMLRQRRDLPDDAKHGLDAIGEAANHAARMTRQLLSLGRRQVIVPQIVSPVTVLDETLRLLTRLLKENIVVRTDVTLGVSTVLADPGQLMQLMLNLCVNAGDAMPDGGELRIGVAMHDSTVDAPEVPVPEGPGPWVVLTVRDTGSGMDDATRERAFEPFFTTKGALGTGIGLATVKSIVDGCGGRISLDSAPGLGTCFTIVLPAATAAEPTAITATPERATGRLTVLIAEDEDGVRALMVTALGGAGHEVLAATNGEEALNIARRYRGTIDLLCTDSVMPRMGGAELAVRFRELFPEAGILVCSGYVEDDALKRGLEAGLFRYLPKPFTSTALLAAAAEVVGQQRRARTSKAD